MLKILQARLEVQQYMNRKFPDVQAGFRKGRRTRDQIANIHWIIGKAREFQRQSNKSLTPTVFLVYVKFNTAQNNEEITEGRLGTLYKLKLSW